MDTEDDHLDRKLLDCFERLGEAFRFIKRDMARDHGLSILQMQILTRLLRHGDKAPSSSELAREFELTRATMGEVVRKLSAKGLLLRRRSPNDRRRYELQHTPKGKEVAQSLARYMNTLHAPLENMGKAEKEALLRSSMSIIHGLIQEGVVNVQRMCYTCRFYRKEAGTGYCDLLELTMDEPRVDCKTHETARP